ncbi:Spx/MgsR family RNA polymerase-binding regulatory protein (plasmid) [Bacillus sp. 31A1R]|uniref:Spx/MgsR family RNA polymerase-binding regulatory protein n=1 Tax=Robertmurraya mangrovi TaxID=3098077 RepID=A0ABU5IV40_9BACI|nr:Spx/MgsR family RNA polymerase-binding regulatory protein [Bacillus sp. 31A1R]MDZ5471015.1 Spx/MgsR family RNA polymerase-binding regulatory protein [Bacillus sp. 31A1R]
MRELTFFTYPSCTSCRKTKKWLHNNAVEYEERHLFRETPSYDEILGLLSLTTEGLDELLATRSQTFKNLGKDIDELSLSEVIKMIIDDPKLLRRPIVTDGKQLVVGYNPDALKSIAKKGLYKLSS